jgi:hypothetical protein
MTKIIEKWNNIPSNNKKQVAKIRLLAYSKHAYKKRTYANRFLEVSFI